MGVCYTLISHHFLALWVVFIQLDFPMRDVHYMYTIIHHYSMEEYTPIFISSFMWFSLFLLSIFLCMLVRILSSKIYFLCFFLASLHIEFIYYFYMVSELQVWSSSTELRSTSSLLSLSEEELQDFLLVCFAGCRDLILEHINSAIWILHQL